MIICLASFLSSIPSLAHFQLRFRPVPSVRSPFSAHVIQKRERPWRTFTKILPFPNFRRSILLLPHGGFARMQLCSKYGECTGVLLSANSSKLKLWRALSFFQHMNEPSMISNEQRGSTAITHHYASPCRKLSNLQSTNPRCQKGR